MNYNMVSGKYNYLRHPASVNKAFEISIYLIFQTDTSAGIDTSMTPRKLKLAMRLSKKTLLAESQRKKLSALRSKTWRLEDLHYYVSYNNNLNFLAGTRYGELHAV